MSKSLNSLVDQAQNVVQSPPLANKISSGHYRPAGPGVQNTNTTSSPGSTTHRSSTFATLKHRFHTLKQRYEDSTPCQRLITASEGLVIDYHQVARDTEASSKEIYMWSQAETDHDLNDVTGRLAYFHFVHKSLAASLAERLDAAVLPLKKLKDEEVDLAAVRTARRKYEQQIIKFQTPSGNEGRTGELEGLLVKNHAQQKVSEFGVQFLKRDAFRKSEEAKWEAIREYAEKLAILAQASGQVLQKLSELPPYPEEYEGAQKTAAIEAAVDKALDDWKPGHVLPAGVTPGQR